MLQNEYLSDVHVTDRFLSVAECDQILAAVRGSRFWAGRLVDPVPNYRVCDVTDEIESTTLKWLTNRLTIQVQSINRVMYQFDLTGRVEPPHVIRYSPRGKIDWHMDVGPSTVSTRKLGVTIQLSASEDYDGGDLEFSPDISLIGARVRGCALIFPSYLTHRVTALRSGTRWSAVTWFHGLPFR